MRASPNVGSTPPKATDGPTRSGPTVISPSTTRTTDSPPIPTEVTAKERTALGYSRIDTPLFSHQRSALFPQRNICSGTANI